MLTAVRMYETIINHYELSHLLVQLSIMVLHPKGSIRNDVKSFSFLKTVLPVSLANRKPDFHFRLLSMMFGA